MTTQAHVVLAQELHILKEGIAEAQQWALGRGWKSVWSEAQAGQGHVVQVRVFEGSVGCFGIVVA